MKGTTETASFASFLNIYLKFDNTIHVGHHYAQTNTNNVNKT